MPYPFPHLLSLLALGLLTACTSSGSDSQASTGPNLASTPPNSLPSPSGQTSLQLPPVAAVSGPRSTPVLISLYYDEQGQWLNWQLAPKAQAKRVQSSGPTAASAATINLQGHQLSIQPAANFNNPVVVEYQVEVRKHPQFGNQILRGNAYLYPSAPEGRFTKLDAASKPLPEQTARYEAEPWSCVYDREHDSVWMIANNDAKSPFYRRATYRFGNGNYHHVESNQAQCALTSGECDTDSLIELANAKRVCGYTDWRLPNTDELHSLLDLKRQTAEQPAIDTRYFPDTVERQAGEFDAAQYANYWSSSTAPSDPELATPYDDGYVGGRFARFNAFTVIFGFGQKQGRYVETRHKGNAHFVRLVRGGSPEQAQAPIYRPEQSERPAVMESFARLDQVGQPSTSAQARCVEDRRYPDRPRTLWQLHSNSAAAERVTQQEAQALAETANRQKLCGRSDWHLPSHTELAMLLVQDGSPLTYRAAYRNYFSDLNPDGSGDSNTFWSSREVRGDITQLYRQFYAVDFGDAKQVAARTRWENGSKRYRVRLIATAPYLGNPTKQAAPGQGPEEVARKDKLAFIRLAADGKTVIPNDALFSNRPWSCVQDLRLAGRPLWAMKRNDLGSNLHHSMESFAFGSNTSSKANCSLSQCNSDAYIAQVNQLGLCARHNWRLPTITELRSLTVQDTLHGLTFKPAYLKTFPDYILGDHNGDRFWSASLLPDGRIYSLAFNLAGSEPFASASSDIAGIRLISDH